MKFNDLDQVTEVHRCGVNSTCRSVVRVDWPAVHEYSKAISGLKRDLGEDSEDAHWQEFLSAAKRVRFLLLSIPLSKAQLQTIVSPYVETMQRLCPAIGRAFPDYARLVAQLCEHVTGIADGAFLDSIEDLLVKEDRNELRRTGVVLPSTSIVRAAKGVGGFAGRLNPVSLLNPRELRAARCYNRLIIIGRPAWYPMYVFAAPRATSLTVLMAGFFSDEFPEYSAFQIAVGEDPDGVSASRVLETRKARPDDTVDEYFPVVNLAQVARASGVGASLLDTTAPIRARLFLLGNGKAMFLESTEESTSLAITPTDSDELEVKRMSNEKLERGDAVIIRTHGEIEYVRSIADRILGSQAAELRACQRDWKDKVRESMRGMSLLEASIELLNLGSTRANEANLGNWIAPSLIRPRDRADFSALMKMAGIVDEEEYWRSMGLIAQAHQRAGGLVRQRLIREMKKANFDSLYENGEIEFGLDELPGETLTALFIDRVGPIEERVSTVLLNRPFEV